jgi:hypothetical protein
VADDLVDADGIAILSYDQARELAHIGGCSASTSRPGRSRVTPGGFRSSISRVIPQKYLRKPAVIPLALEWIGQPRRVRGP